MKGKLDGTAVKIVMKKLITDATNPKFYKKHLQDLKYKILFT